MTNVTPLGPSFDEDWWSTEPELHRLDYEAPASEKPVDRPVWPVTGASGGEGS